MIKTDILIIGGGPTGLFTVFEAGLFKNEMPYIRLSCSARGAVY